MLNAVAPRPYELSVDYVDAKFLWPDTQKHVSVDNSVWGVDRAKPLITGGAATRGSDRSLPTGFSRYSPELVHATRSLYDAYEGARAAGAFAGSTPTNPPDDRRELPALKGDEIRISFEQAWKSGAHDEQVIVLDSTAGHGATIRAAAVAVADALAHYQVKGDRTGYVEQV